MNAPRALVDERRRRQGIDDALAAALVYGALPAWALAGLWDWQRHRRTGIETTTGMPEALLHLVMLVEAGVPILAALAGEPDAGLLALCAGGLAAHQVTAAIDVALADGMREVSPSEQHAHGLLEQVPVMATIGLFVLHWDQALTLIGRGGTADWRLRRRRRRPPGGAAAFVVAACAGLIVVPYVEELARCLRARRAGVAIGGGR